MHITCGHLTGALLQNVFSLDWTSYGGNPSVNGKDGPDGNINIDIGRTVQGINRYYIFAALILKINHLIVFLRYDGTYLPSFRQRPGESDIGNNIQVLLFLPLNIDLSECTDDITQTRPVDLSVNDFCCQGNVPKELRQLSGGERKIILLAFDKSIKGNPHGIAQG